MVQGQRPHPAQPLQEHGRVNALAKMYVEIDGKTVYRLTRELTYAECDEIVSEGR